MAIESDILSALKTTLEGLSWVKTVEYERIRLNFSDFGGHEVPAIQLIDGGQVHLHQNRRLETTWTILIEVVMKSTSFDLVDQGVLLDRRAEVEQLIGANVDLDVPGMIHMRYVGNVTDIHMVDPYFYSQLTFEAVFHKDYTGAC
jgi:hypothetical protein